MCLCVCLCGWLVACLPACLLSVSLLFVLGVFLFFCRDGDQVADEDCGRKLAAKAAR